MCGAHWKSKSYPELLCGKNGSINLELVKSLLSLRMEKERKRKRVGKESEVQGGGERGKEREV